jgi:LmbE family N-acetylglucosaminyl deacetylase
MKTLGSVLAIGAHPDDIELGCGGSLAKLVEMGVNVRALILSRGTVGNRADHDRLDETRRALKLLGVTDVVTADFPDTRMYLHAAEVITCIEAQVRDLKPDRVYTMFENDRHQDHRTTFEATIVACREVRQILSYETPSSLIDFQPQVIEDIGDYLGRKIDALALHKSQCDRPYTQPEAMRIKAMFRGQQVGIGPAEGFIGYKIIL